MRSLFFSAIMITANVAMADTVQTIPEQGPEIRGTASGHLTGWTTDFQETEDGTYTIRVYARFSRPHAPNRYVTAGYFVPSNGSIYRNEDRLYWSVNGQAVEIARTSFWSTFPKWSLEGGVVQTRLTRIGGPFSEKYTASVKLLINE